MAMIRRTAQRAGRSLALQVPFAAPCSRLASTLAASVDTNMTDSGMYNWRVAAVQNALAQRGKAEGPLDLNDLLSLGHLDQYHYHGVQACDTLAAVLGLDATSRVLDVGSGIGGPARYLAMQTGCDVTGVEMQADLAKAATDLTSRVGLDARVRFLTGDFVKLHLSQRNQIWDAAFDHVISQLVFLHIPNRPALLDACFARTKPGGTFYIEDFIRVESRSFTTKECTQLTDVVHAQTVTSTSEYVAALEAAGYVDVHSVDLTDGWRDWSQARYEQYWDSKAETVKMHGESVFQDRVAFYKVIADLFNGCNLGGVRLTGRRRSMAEEKLFCGRQMDLKKHSQAVLNEHGDFA